MRRPHPPAARCPRCAAALPAPAAHVACAACGLSATDAAYRDGEAVPWYSVVRAVDCHA